MEKSLFYFILCRIFLFSVHKGMDNRNLQTHQSVVQACTKRNEDEEMPANKDFNRSDEKRELITHMFIAVFVLVSVGTLSGLVWNILQAGDRMDRYEVRINALEKDPGSHLDGLKTKQQETGATNASTGSPPAPGVTLIKTIFLSSTIQVTDVLQSTLATNIPIGETTSTATLFTKTKPVATIAAKTTTTNSPTATNKQLGKTTTSPATKFTMTKIAATAAETTTTNSPTTTDISIEKTTTSMPSFTTATTATASESSSSSSSTTTRGKTRTRSTSSPTAFPTAFKVLQTNETTHLNFSFLAVQVEVPTDGRSVSENWCRDYENLCKQFSRRPTGCGIQYLSKAGFKKCAEVYNSDMNIGNVLGCTPTSQVAIAVRAALSDLSPPVTYSVNAFAFYSCKPEECQNTIKLSENALHRMNGFWDSNMTTMYTVCR